MQIKLVTSLERCLIRDLLHTNNSLTQIESYMLEYILIGYPLDAIYIKLPYTYIRCREIYDSIQGKLKLAGAKT